MYTDTYRGIDIDWTTEQVPLVVITCTEKKITDFMAYIEPSKNLPFKQFPWPHTVDQLLYDNFLDQF